MPAARLPPRDSVIVRGAAMPCTAARNANYCIGVRTNMFATGDFLVEQKRKQEAFELLNNRKYKED